MNELQVFDFNHNEVRTILIDQEPYFVGKDVANVLGYANARDALSKHIDIEDKGVAKCDTLGGKQDLTIINESGVYSLVFGSKLPEAKKFKRWVTSEVLPKLRKTGAYHLPSTYKEALREVILRIEENEKLQLQNVVQTQQIAELQPKADYVDRILQNKGLVTITAIAKDYGMSAIKFNELLHEHKIQYKQSEQWFLYTKYQDKGYTHSSTTDITHKDGTVSVKMNTKWTQKGRLFLYEFLKERDIFPRIELN